MGAVILTLLELQVSSFGYEIYDVHMPHPIPLLKEGVKREEILRIMVFGGCERTVFPFLDISVGNGHGNLYVEVVVALSCYEIAFQRTDLPDAHLVSAAGKVGIDDILENWPVVDPTIHIARKIDAYVGKVELTLTHQ